MLVLSLGFIFQLVSAVDHSFYYQICKFFEVKSVTLFLFEPIDLGLLIATFWRQF